MAKLIYFDFECANCSNVFEDLVESSQTELPCPQCASAAVRVVSGTRLDPGMGVDLGFPTMAAKWEKTTRARAKNDKLTDNPNLWMY